MLNKLIQSKAIFMVPIVLVGMFVVYLSMGVATNEAKLKSEGIDTLAQVIAKREERRNSGGSNSSTYLASLIDLEYQMRDGTSRTVEAEIGGEEWDVTEIGDEIGIRYLADDISFFALEGEALGGGAKILRYIGFAIIAVGLLLTWMAMRMGRWAAEVGRSGNRTQGVITELIHHDNRDVFRFTYTDATGTEHMGQTQPQKPVHQGRMGKGDAIEIAYDPKKPRHGIWVGDLPRV